MADVRGHIVLWNPAAEQLFGYATSEAVGRPVGLVIPDRLLAQHRAGFANFARTGHGPIIDSDEPVEVPARHKTGIEVPVELSLTVLEPTAAGGRFVLAIIRDATMRHRAEAQRAEVIREQARRAERNGAPVKDVGRYGDHVVRRRLLLEVEINHADHDVREARSSLLRES